MPQIPLPKGLTSTPDFPKLRETLVNMMWTPSGLVSRPGVTLEATGTGRCRKSFEFKDLHYQVSGGFLIRHNKNNTIDNIGVIAGSADCEVSIGHVNCAIVVKGGLGYKFDGTTLTQIFDVNYKASVDTTYINGVFLYVPSDGSPLFFSELNDPGNILGSSFFDAETLPDKNTGIYNLRNDIYALGENSVELFRDRGVDPRFRRVEGGMIPIGFVSGKTDYADSFIFLGKDSNYGIHLMGQGNAPRVSNGAIDTILNEEYTLEELQTCVAQRLRWRDSDVAIFHLPRHTLAYYGEWAVFEGTVDGPYRQVPWAAKYITFVYGEYYTGSVQDASIGIIADVNTDFGNKMEKGFDTFALSERGSNFKINMLELDCLTGQEDTEYSVSLSLSKDARLWGPTVWESLGKIGDYRIRVKFSYPGGLGYFETYAGIRIRTSDDVSFAVQALYAKQ